MTKVIEKLGKNIAELSIEKARLESDNETLANFINDCLGIFEILNLYLKPERHLVTAIIDGEDAKMIADFFGFKLDKVKE